VDWIIQYDPPDDPKVCPLSVFFFTLSLTPPHSYSHSHSHSLTLRTLPVLGTLLCLLCVFCLCCYFFFFFFVPFPALGCGHGVHPQGGQDGAGGGRGRALLFLIPEELAFLKYLKDAKVPLNESEFPDNKLAQIQAQLEKLIAKNYSCTIGEGRGAAAVPSWYNSHSTMKHIFNVHRLEASRYGGHNSGVLQ